MSKQLVNVKGADGTTGPTGPTGATGPTGPAGTAATITVGTTTTGAPGTNASVTATGSSNAPVLNFTIPRGADGTSSTTVAGLPIFATPAAVFSGTTDYVLLNSTDANAQWGSGSIVSSFNPPTIVATITNPTSAFANNNGSYGVDYNPQIAITILDTGGWTTTNGCTLTTSVTFYANRILKTSYSYSFSNATTDTRTINFGTAQEWLHWRMVVTSTLTSPTNQNFSTVAYFTFGVTEPGYYT
jgi:hypothetical protein